MTREEQSIEPVEPSFGKFACRHDIALLRHVVHEKPWEAEHGSVMEKWTRIAEELNRRQDFDKPKKGTNLKNRFDLLLKRFQDDEARSKRKSGTPEEYNERDQLLTDIKCRIDDHASSVASSKERSKRKAEAIENSGLLLRQLAMDEIIQGESIVRTKKKRTTTPILDANGLLDTIQKGIQQKQQNDAKMVQLMQERLEFDRDQATRQAEQHNAMQQMILALFQ
ncbi:unnamed protein product, partial [Aphanomyces euteiches]